MGFNESFARSLGGHRELIRRQQEEIEKLKEDFRNFEDATTQMINQSELIESFRDEVADVRPKLDDSQKGIHDELETIKTDIQTLKDNPDTSTFRFDDIELRLSTLQDAVSEVKTLRRSIRQLRKAHGFSEHFVKKYRRSWRNLFMFNVLIIAVALYGVEKSYNRFDGLLSGLPLPTMNFFMVTGGVAVVTVFLYFIEKSAWKAVSVPERKYLRLFESNIASKLIILATIFIYAVSSLWGSIF